MTCHVITCSFTDTESTVVLVIICCHEMTVCGFFHWSVMMIDGDRWLFFTDGNISKWHHCNDRAAYDRYQTRARMLLCYTTQNPEVFLFPVGH